MSKIDVVFAFDVEDAVNPESDAALVSLCRIFSEEDVAVSLFVAAEKARAMRRRGRWDAIEAMRRHEICYHGNYWGDFPEPALVYGSRLSWDEAVQRALAIETPGLNDVAEITGRFPVAWCCHQAQQCPQMAYALKLAGVRCWAGGPRGWIMNWLSWPRSGCALSSQGSWTHSVDPTNREELKPAADPDEDLAKAQADFERVAETKDFITFAGHPACFVTAEWGGLYSHAVLFRDGVAGPYPRPTGVSTSQPRSEADRNAALEFVRKLLRWIKTRHDVNITSYTSLCERDEEEPVLWIEWDRAVALARRIEERFTYIVDGGASFSPADVLGLLVFAVDHMWRQGKWPDRLPVQRLLGPTDKPLTQEAEIRAAREDLFAGSLAAYSVMMDQRRIPGAIRARFVDIGPADLLHLLCRFITQSVETGSLPEEVTVAAGPPLPEAADEPVITDRRFHSTNNPAGMDMSRLWDLLRWQSWSYRPAVAHR